MTHYPITNPVTKQPDKRYSVDLEYMGHSKPRHVLRYEGNYIGSFANLPQATLRAIGHRSIVVQGQEPITEKKP